MLVLIIWNSIITIALIAHIILAYRIAQYDIEVDKHIIAWMKSQENINLTLIEEVYGADIVRKMPRDS